MKDLLTKLGINGTIFGFGGLCGAERYTTLSHAILTGIGTAVLWIVVAAVFTYFTEKIIQKK